MDKTRERFGTGIRISQYELFGLLVWSLRYAVGRQTYVVQEVCDLLRKYHEVLTDDQRAQIASDILGALKDAGTAGRFLGATFDEREWREVLKLYKPEDTST